MLDKRRYLMDITALGFDKDVRAQALDDARTKLVGYPKNGCAITLWSALNRVCHFDSGPPVFMTNDIIDQARKLGFQVVLGHPLPELGDIFVTTDLNQNGVPDHVGIVLGVVGPNHFFCFDNGGAPYRRNITKVEPHRTPVAYYLRLPS